MEFKVQDEVTVSIPQLHNRTSVIEKGEILSIAGNSAQVMLEGEDVPRTVPLDRMQLAEELLGGTTGRPNEMPVIDAIRY